MELASLLLNVSKIESWCESLIRAVAGNDGIACRFHEMERVKGGEPVVFDVGCRGDDGLYVATYFKEGGSVRNNVFRISFLAIRD
ncbi:hypothetical protein C497_02137 [Halalkalicoccus jeotgali B3]|uniref:Uncharacterized protein n=1 Tax=Halalkalicoccus jeotgali (strain DSM 18796 / CECT 7217 / JCM 14584 / KCTC 4019 / B3) TaxID=795797 RepID=D8JBR0_HALJB|nr:hypothetical protein HacjB3_16816 [Halalkalicoccus jeotgali B3]ELY40844.1 hypothetical protein C497_02137 [Halalkalicoccus jeotgali B3]